MNNEAKQIWKTPQGASLLKKMLGGGPLGPQDRQTLDELKRADPPTQEFLEPAKKERQRQERADGQA